MEDESLLDARIEAMFSRFPQICVPNRPPIPVKRRRSLLSPNRIRTAKYTLLTFLPLNLWHQFHVFANLYFLCMAGMQMLPWISDSGGIPFILLPLGFVLAVTAIKDGLEDYNRYKADFEENNQDAALVIPDGEACTVVHWEALRVGDVIRLGRGDRVPADVVILASCDEGGQVFIGTENLDGETSLKQKTALPHTNRLIVSDGDAGNLNSRSGICRTRLKINCEAPCESLHSFHGVLHIEGSSDGPLPLTVDQVIFRGSTVETTSQVWAVVVYTGHETRILRNAMKLKPRYKLSKLMLCYNKHIISLFAIQFALCTITAMLHLSLSLAFLERHFYLPRSNLLTVIEVFGAQLLQLTQFVPISVLATLEVVKVIQSMLVIDRDPEMPGCKTNTCTILEELGSVRHVFTDKTGTLTENKMLLKSLCIVRPGLAASPSSRVLVDGAAGDKEDHSPLRTRSAGLSDFWSRSMHESVPRCLRSHVAADFPADQLRMEWSSSKGTESKLLMLAMSVCHSVMARSQEYSADLVLDASSPDELALVAGAASLGLVFAGRSASNEVRLKVEHSWTAELLGCNVGEIIVKVLLVLPFDSDRKRMSVVIEHNREAIMLCKGADSTMFEAATGDVVNPELAAAVNGYAEVGLRTLVFGWKRFDTAEFAELLEEHRDACLEDSAERTRCAVDALESGLQLFGCSGVEDMLQPRVPETLAAIREHGLKVWMLTGDRVETAVNIGRSAGLFPANERSILLDSTDAVELSELMDSPLPSETSKGARIIPLEEPCPGQHMVLTGESLSVILSSRRLREQLFTAPVSSVLACRVTPAQKTELVIAARSFCSGLVLRGEQEVRGSSQGGAVLAIGDGANDVGMIQAAEVGVAVAGYEGAQAVRASDFAISRFNHLERLLLYHGPDLLRKNSFVVYYSIFKNAGFSLLPFVYGLVCAFSAANVYHVVLKQFYNTAYTALPVIAFAVFDRPDLLATCPGRWPPRFSGQNLIIWISRGLWCTLSFLVGTLLPFAAFTQWSTGIFSPEGFTGISMQAFGLMVTANSVVFFNLAIYIWSTSPASNILYGVGSVLFLATWLALDKAVFDHAWHIYLCSPMGLASVLLSLSLAGLSLVFVVDSHLARFEAIEEGIELHEKPHQPGIIESQASPHRGKRKHPTAISNGGEGNMHQAEADRMKFIRFFADGINPNRIKGRCGASAWEKVAEKMARDGEPAQLAREASDAPASIDYWKGQFPWDDEVRRRNRFTFGNQEGFRPNQLETINAVLSNRDVFLVMPTGGGKSLCYQIPALVKHEARRGGTTVVVCPLVSLILDQETQLSQCGVMCSGLTSSTAHTMPSAETFKKLFSAKLRVLFVTPERLSASKRLLDLLAGLYKHNLLHGFVIDEAHCVSQWGHDFREDYLELSNLRKTFPGVPILAMTATAKPEIITDIMAQLGMPKPSTVIIRTSLNRTNISYSVIKKPAKGKMLEALAAKIKELGGEGGRGSGIVYCMSKKDCDQVCSGLRAYALKAAVYHADLPQTTRDINQKMWMDNEARAGALHRLTTSVDQLQVQVMAATVAFGMGINKRDVRFVIHYSMPKTLEAFYQESGRAGRDGKPSYSVIYYDYYSKTRNQWLIEQGGEGGARSAFSSPGRTRQISEQKKSLLALVAYCESNTQCRRIILLKYLEQESGLVTTCLDSSSLLCDVCLQHQQGGITGEGNLEVSCEAEAFALLSLCDEALSKGIKPTLCSLKDAAISSNAKSMLPAWRSLPSFGCLASNEPPFTGPLVLSLLRSMVVEGALVEEVVSIGVHGAFAAYVSVGDRAACSRVAIVRKATKRGRKTPKSARGPASSPASARNRRGVRKGLREALEGTRRRLAELNGILRTDAIFSDDVIEQCLSILPTTLEQLSTIQGLGEFRVAAYGPAMLEVLADQGEPDKDYSPPPLRVGAAASTPLPKRGLPVFHDNMHAARKAYPVTSTPTPLVNATSQRVLAMQGAQEASPAELNVASHGAIPSVVTDILQPGARYPFGLAAVGTTVDPAPKQSLERRMPAGTYDHLFDGLF
ncbi:hypothetical protein FOL47_000115 [Perkinsus chesapeaki]|uniref:Uncharacterized protein n=1 Tax=Perkinsus chesapeaki TaxID=330153 RepID=A0A7J6N1C6_PERCH|nr:hypothetical protein FOL47_000115 [Perkinsus chesapeaki]